MAQIAVTPIILRDCVLTVGTGTDTYEKHVSGVQFIPASSTVDWTGLNPDAVFKFPTSTTWTLQISYAQDWATTNSLSQYLFDNDGKLVKMTFRPVKGGVGFEANVYVTPGAIGGDVNSVAVATVTMGIAGKPTKVVAG